MHGKDKALCKTNSVQNKPILYYKRFKRSKCLKGCFYLWITLIKKNTRVHMRCTQDKFCSKQIQPLLQTDLPLHVHTRSCKKSDDIWSSNNISSRPNFPSPNLIIGFRITMVNETCIFCGFKRSKCLKVCFYLWITLIKKNYKDSHEMCNAHSYLRTDKMQTYKNTCLGRIGYVLI
jgi:hypothetical protein